MRSFKQVVGWIGVGLSVLGMAAALAGILGSWTLRSRVTEWTSAAFALGQQAGATAAGAVERIDDRLAQAQDRVGTLEEAISGAGQRLGANSLVGTVVANQVSEEAALSIREARATAQALVETVAILDEAIQSANRIPFVNLDGTVPGLVSDLSAGLAQLEADMTAFRTTVQERREERIASQVGRLTDLTTTITERIGTTRAELDAQQARLAELSARLSEAEDALDRRITRLVLLANLALLLAGLAFASLLAHSWRLARNPDLSFEDLIGTA